MSTTEYSGDDKLPISDQKTESHPLIKLYPSTNKTDNPLSSELKHFSLNIETENREPNDPSTHIMQLNMQNDLSRYLNNTTDDLIGAQEELAEIQSTQRKKDIEIRRIQLELNEELEKQRQTEEGHRQLQLELVRSSALVDKYQRESSLAKEMLETKNKEVQDLKCKIEETEKNKTNINSPVREASHHSPYDNNNNNQDINEYRNITNKKQYEEYEEYEQNEEYSHGNKYYNNILMEHSNDNKSEGKQKQKQKQKQNNIINQLNNNNINQLNNKIDHSRITKKLLIKNNELWKVCFETYRKKKRTKELEVLRLLEDANKERNYLKQKQEQKQNANRMKIYDYDNSNEYKKESDKLYSINNNNIINKSNYIDNNICDINSRSRVCVSSDNKSDIRNMRYEDEGRQVNNISVDFRDKDKNKDNEESVFTDRLKVLKDLVIGVDLYLSSQFRLKA